MLRPPLNDPELFTGGDSGGYILATGRVNAGKRQHLLVEALCYAPRVRLVIAGPPDDQESARNLIRLAEQKGIQDRISMHLRFLPRPELAQLVNGASAVAYLPFDEDSLGYCTMEAFQASKPVITTTDSGGVLDIVRERQTGLIVPPDPKALGAAMAALAADQRFAEDLGRAGHAAMEAEQLNWPATVEKLLS